MKHTTIRLALLFCVILFSFSCKDSGPVTKKVHIKIGSLKKMSAIRAEKVGSSTPIAISVPGKIYVYNDYLFINESGKGIHVVDNKNPSFPKIINFIKIPGNVDMAVNDNFLYADCYVDLLTFDISNPAHIKLKNRTKDVFNGFYVDPAAESIYILKDTVVTVSTETGWIEGRGGLVNFNVGAAASDSKSSGQGGSMARFTLMNDHLYTVDHSSLGIFDVSNPSTPAFVKNQQLGWGIETIFPYDNKLFIGTTTGMQIFDATIASSPVFASTYAHLTSCDPVIVAGKYAYVTLRSGNGCWRGVDQLDVLNVEDILHPILVKSYPMQNPHGLGISGKYLYLAEGAFGIKSFDIADPLKISDHKIQHLTGFHAFDIIPASKSLIVTGDDGVFQFNYSNPSNIKQISKLKIHPITDQ